MDIQFSKESLAVRAHNGLAVEGQPAGATAQATLSSDTLRANIAADMQESVRRLEAVRTGSKDRIAVDLSFAQFAKDYWGFAPSDNGSPDSFLQACGINPDQHTVDSLLQTPEFNGFRWLVPELFREAIRLGLRKSPIHPNLIIADQGVSQPTVQFPQIEMSDAAPMKVGEGATIPVGSTKFGEKTVKLYKCGRGIEVSYEVLSYVSLNVVGLFFQDMGIKLGMGLDKLMLDCLISGDQSNGSEAAAVIGVGTANSPVYKDFLRAWLRASRLGKNYAGIIASEDTLLNILDIPEFKALAGTGTLVNMDIQTSIPRSQKLWAHSYVPANKMIFVDPTMALLKLTAQALQLESEKIVNRQITGTYATFTTGFANVFRDGRLIMDTSIAYAGNGFPAWMDPSAQENVIFK